MTQSEIIDNMTIDQIIRHPQFISLALEEGGLLVDHWKITFVNKRRTVDDRWPHLVGGESKFFYYYKLKV